jgi:hypothetical protein
LLLGVGFLEGTSLTFSLELGFSVIYFTEFWTLSVHVASHMTVLSERTSFHW